ncbi:MAG: hypothetical protein HOA75_18565 [Deltaproteobacteria bacterium]|nr:hypothetical protein [Deltaproteobacteria bacterium]
MSKRRNCANPGRSRPLQVLPATLVPDPTHRRELASQRLETDYNPSLGCWKPATTLVSTPVGTSNRGTLAGRSA